MQSHHQRNIPTYLISFLTLLFTIQVSTAQQLWSDPATWGGNKPISGEAVTIPAGMHILLDEDTPDLGGLTIEGILEFDYQNLNLTADWIMLMGTLQVGTVNNPFTNQATITINASNMNENIMGMGTRGIMVMGGNLELHGTPPSIPWTKLNANAVAGSTNLVLKDAISWDINDELIIGPTDFYEAANGASITQSTQLTQTTSNQITINTGLNAHRWGALQYVTPTGMSLSNTNIVTPPAGSGFTPTTLDERAPVANLTRNIVIQAPNDALWQTNDFGVHIMVMRMGGTGMPGMAHIDGVEIKRGGQKGNLGRYPFHWHMISYNGSNELGDATGQYIRNSVINQSRNRGIVIHGTNGTLVQNNVVYDVRGHGIFTEDASERRNIIDGNLVLHIRNPDTGFALKIHEEGSNAGRGSSGFWISNPDNTVTNNMAGDCNTNGFWLAFPENTWGLSSGINMRPDRLLFGIFENNTAHSNGIEGINLDWVEIDQDGNISPSKYISTTDGQDPQWPYPNKRRFTLKGASVWKNGGSGLWDRSDWPDNIEIINADNCFSMFAGAGEFGVIERCLAVGNSLNHLMNGTDRDDLSYSLPPAAFATYHSTFDIKDNIVVSVPMEAGYASGAFATNDYYIRPVEKGHIRNPNNLLIDSHPGVKLESGYNHFVLAGALWDPYGIWGGNSGDYLIYDDPFFTTNLTTTPVAPGPASGGVLAPGPFFGFEGFVINQANPRWYALMELDVERLDDNFNTVGTWTVAEGQNGGLLANMRHFATHPSDYYKLTFPSVTEVNDVGITMTNMLADTDYQVIAIEYSGNYTVNQIYATTVWDYEGEESAPASATKHIYQQVACLSDVVNAPVGEVYWQDAENDLVWIKVRGGITPDWSPGTYAPDSDEEQYRNTYLRVVGDLGAPVAVDIFATDFNISILPNPTDDIFEIQGLLSNYNIQILDINGNIYQDLSTTDSSIAIDISTLPNGMFFIRIQDSSNGNLHVEKILKSN